MSYSAGASPPTPESVAPTVAATRLISARMAGTACRAGVPPGSPAFRPTENCTVRPSALMKLAVARYSWYARAVTCAFSVPGAGTAGSAPAGPRRACSRA